MIPPQPGMTGWLWGETGRLRPRTPVRVVEVSDGGMVAVVRYGRYGQRRIYTHNLDVGREWRTRSGRWIPESDPRVRQWLLKAIADIRAGGTRACSSDDARTRQARLQEYLWLLSRNGW